jgi:hypothetical protein
VRSGREDDVHPGARWGPPVPAQDDDALPAVEGEGQPPEALDIRAPEDDVAPGQQRIERRHPQLRVERLGGDHGHRGVAVRGAPRVAVTHDAEAGPDLQPLTTVAGLLGSGGARAPVVAVPWRGEQADDLDDVQDGLAQGRGPALSINP